MGGRILALGAIGVLVCGSFGARAEETNETDHAVGTNLGLALVYDMLLGTPVYQYGPTSYNDTWIVIFNPVDEDNLTLTLPNGSALVSEVFIAYRRNTTPFLEVYFRNVNTTATGPYTVSSPAGLSWNLPHVGTLFGGTYEGSNNGGGGGGGGGDPGCPPLSTVRCNTETIMSDRGSSRRPARLSSTSSDYPLVDCYKQRQNLELASSINHVFTRRDDGVAGTILKANKRVNVLLTAKGDTVIDEYDAYALMWTIYGRTSGAGRWAYVVGSADHISDESWAWKCKDANRDGAYQYAYYRAMQPEFGVRRNPSADNFAVDIKQVTSTRGSGEAEAIIKTALKALAEWVKNRYPGDFFVDDFVEMITGSKIKSQFNKRDDGSRVDRVFFNHYDEEQQSYGAIIDEQIGQSGDLPFYAEFQAQAVVRKITSGGKDEKFMAHDLPVANKKDVFYRVSV